MAITEKALELKDGKKNIRRVKTDFAGHFYQIMNFGYI